MRYERVKLVLINLSFSDALQHLLEQIGLDPDEAQELSERWFTEAEAKTEVAELFERFALDEYAIEAEAVRRSSGELKFIQRMLRLLDPDLRMPWPRSANIGERRLN